MRVLIWDKNPLQAQNLSRYFNDEGCLAETLPHYKALRNRLRSLSQSPVLVLLNTQSLSRLSQIQSLQQLAPLASILVVCHGQSIQEHLDVLNAGADSLIVQPYALDLLLAQGKALLRHGRRSQQRLTKPEATLVHVGALKCFPTAQIVQWKNHKIQLNPRAFALFLFLCEHPEKIHGREDLYQMIWGGESTRSFRQVDNAIASLRQALKPLTCVQLESHYGKGYSLTFVIS